MIHKKNCKVDSMTTKIQFKHPSSDFTDYLNKHRISSFNNDENISVSTHLSMSQPYGKFSIPQCDMDTFMTLYEKEIENGSTLGIVEKPLSHMETPLICDIDLKYELKDDKDVSLIDLRKYNFRTIKDIVSVYKSVYDKNFHFKNTDDMYHSYFFVTQRNAPYLCDNNGKKIVKDGIHIINPGYRAFPSVHLKMRNQVLQNEKIIECIKNLNVDNSIEDIFDEQVICKNGWLMYGSTKPNKEPYEITYIFDHNLNEINKSDLQIKSYARYFSYWRETTQYAIPNKDVIDSVFNKQETSNEETLHDDVIEKKEVELTDKNKPSRKKNNRIEIIEAENPDKCDIKQINKTKDLVDLLSDKRANVKSLWKEVGECLKNLSFSQYDEEYLKIWVQFSENCNTFTEDDCIKEWKNFKKEDRLSMLTLRFWVSRDNIDGYKDFQRNEIRNYLSKGGLNTTHVDVAKTLFLMYETLYVCSSLKHNTWYEFRKHRWYEIESGITLRKKISKELALEYVNFRDFCTKMAENNDDEDLYELSSEQWLSMVSICDDIIVKLKTKGYKDSLLAEAKDLFYKEKFEEKLDERHELLGFDNGILDLDKRLFREGRPEDFITLTTKTKYIPKYKEKTEYTQIKDFLKQIYLTDEMVHYALKERASMLHGDNYEERIYTHIGGGGNGKSKWREACTLACGDYVFGFPVTLFTGKRSLSSTASPEIARSKGKRIAYIDEPEDSSIFNIGLAKKFSGGDPIETRKLYGDMFEFIPQFTMTLLCNNIPGMPAHDEGLWRRMTIMEHCSRFVDNPSAPNEFKRDRTLSKKIKAWPNVLSSMLVDYFYLYQDEGLNPPNDVTKFTTHFIKECDSYNEFITDTLIPSDDNENYIVIKDLYNNFKSWSEDNGLHKKPMSFRDFKKYIEKKINKKGVVREGRIYGFRERIQF